METIHDLATDDAVAAVVTTDFLRRPAVANKAMADDTARHAVNEAQFDRFRQQAQFVHEEAAPQLQRMEHSAQFMDLVAACAQFVTTAGRIVPNLRVHTLGRYGTLRRPQAFIEGRYGRLRAALPVGDTTGSSDVWLVTSATDTRGTPQPGATGSCGCR